MATTQQQPPKVEGGSPELAVEQGRQVGFGVVDFLLLLVVSFWGINFSATKIALEDMQPLTFSALRTGLALVFFLVVLWRREGKAGYQLPLADWRRVAVLGFFGNFLFIICFVIGLSSTAVGVASLIQALTPLVVAVLALLFFGQRLKGSAWLGIAVSLGGLLLVIFGSAGVVAAGDWSGILLVVASMVSWAVYTLFSGPLLARYSPYKMTTLAGLVGIPPIILVAMPSLLSENWAAIGWQAWLATVYSGLCSIGVAYLLWYYAISRVGGTRTAVYANLVPVVAILFAWLVRGEALTAWELLGGAVVLVGIALTRRK